jgi:hypothetical protein
MGAGLPGHCSEHWAFVAQVTPQSSVHRTVQTAPSWQVAVPPSPSVIWQVEPLQVTALPKPATSVQVAPGAQVAVQEAPQLPMQVPPSGHDSMQPVVQV